MPVKLGLDALTKAGLVILVLLLVVVSMAAAAGAGATAAAEAVGLAVGVGLLLGQTDGSTVLTLLVEEALVTEC